GRVARRRGRSSPLGSLLDPVADKLLVLSVLIVLIDQDVFPGWMVAAIVAREFLVSGLRLAAMERGVVMHARDLGKLKTWSQATAAAIGGFAAAGAWDQRVAWWALLVALVLTWLSGLDYARLAPGLLRGPPGARLAPGSGAARLPRGPRARPARAAAAAAPRGAAVPPARRPNSGRRPGSAGWCRSAGAARRSAPAGRARARRGSRADGEE